jgi:hypothetical protein
MKIRSTDLEFSHANRHMTKLLGAFLQLRCQGAEKRVNEELISCTMVELPHTKQLYTFIYVKCLYSST